MEPGIFSSENCEGRKFICANHDTESDFRHIECLDHGLCLSCEYISIRTGACIVCERELTAKEKEFKTKIKYSCFKCINGVSTGKKSVCYCHLCIPCAQQISLLSKCPICAEKPKKIDFAIKYFCNNCSKSFELNKLIKFGCEHKFCAKCFLEIVNKALKSKNIMRQKKGICCGKCEHLINSKILETYLTHESFKMIMGIINTNYDCPLCTSVCTEIDEFFMCTNCNNLFVNHAVILIATAHALPQSNATIFVKSVIGHLTVIQ